MKQLARRASLVVVLLLASVGAAAAECAWVLWSTAYKMQGDKPVSETVDPSRAFTSKEDCERAVDRRDVREDQRRKADPSTKLFFTCLPDTIDPRGPKGK
jgi:hypothetical protein